MSLQGATIREPQQGGAIVDFSWHILRRTQSLVFGNGGKPSAKRLAVTRRVQVKKARRSIRKRFAGARDRRNYPGKYQDTRPVHVLFVVIGHLVGLAAEL